LEVIAVTDAPHLPPALAELRAAALDLATTESRLSQWCVAQLETLRELRAETEQILKLLKRDPAARTLEELAITERYARFIMAVRILEELALDRERAGAALLRVVMVPR
jgi:hypothetical protein